MLERRPVSTGGMTTQPPGSVPERRRSVVAHGAQCLRRRRVNGPEFSDRRRPARSTPSTAYRAASRRRFSPTSATVTPAASRSTPRATCSSPTPTIPPSPATRGSCCDSTPSLTPLAPHRPYRRQRLGRSTWARSTPQATSSSSTGTDHAHRNPARHDNRRAVRQRRSIQRAGLFALISFRKSAGSISAATGSIPTAPAPAGSGSTARIRRTATSSACRPPSLRVWAADAAIAAAHGLVVRRGRRIGKDS